MTNAEKGLEIALALGAAPIARWLNYSAAIKDGALIHRLGFAEPHIGNPGIRALHGGVIATFLEFSAQAELAAHLGRAEACRTVSISTDYLAPSRAEDMQARVTIRRVARRIAFLDAVGWQEDEARPVAAARLCLRIKAATAD